MFRELEASIVMDRAIGRVEIGKTVKKCIFNSDHASESTSYRIIHGTQASMVTLWLGFFRPALLLLCLGPVIAGEVTF